MICIGTWSGEWQGPCPLLGWRGERVVGHWLKDRFFSLPPQSFRISPSVILSMERILKSSAFNKICTISFHSKKHPSISLLSSLLTYPFYPHEPPRSFKKQFLKKASKRLCRLEITLQRWGYQRTNNEHLVFLLKILTSRLKSLFQ